jgi:hypothetical protein
MFKSVFDLFKKVFAHPAKPATRIHSYEPAPKQPHSFRMRSLSGMGYNKCRKMACRRKVRQIGYKP